MKRQWFYITIVPRGEVVQRFLQQQEAEVYVKTFNRVMRNTEIRAEFRREPAASKNAGQPPSRK